MGFFLNMLLVLVLGTIIEKTLQALRFRVRLFYPILNVFWRMGIIFHELSHFFIAKIMFIPVRWADINFNDRGGGSVHFEIESYEYQKRISFIKQLLVSVAPLWLGTCAIMELRNIFTNNDLIGIKIISVVSIIIIMYVFVPSSADIRFISFIIGLKPFVFIKQVLFLTISFLIYNAFFDFFYRFAPIYPYLFEFLMLILLEGGLELVFMILKFVIPKILSITPSNTIGFYS
ncbi:MAG: hypothetical protein ACTSX0_03995, partial [Promethearchaeota archaeon]